MSAMEGIANVMSRISTISAGPSAISEIQSRFGVSLYAAATASATTTSGTVGSTAAAGVKDVTSSSTAVISTTGGTATTSTSSTGSASPSNSTASSPDWASRLPDAGKPWANQIETTAKQYGLQPEFLGAVIWTESGFNPNAVSPDGAIGMGQLMPATAAWLGVDPYDPAQNIDGAARYYRNLIDRFGGSVELGTAAYFAGPTAVSKAGAIPSDRANAYVTKILSRRDELLGL